MLLPLGLEALAEDDKGSTDEHCQEAYIEGYDSGYQEGLLAGRENSHDAANYDGYGEGYRDGYSDGYDDCMAEHGLDGSDETHGYAKIEKDNYP